jgi:aerobic-type carbon monoxide dehydrogenase small subunit (CoxS/CutS family)
MDELTYAADVDPLELRLRSDTDVDQAERGRAASAGMLSAGCLRGRLHLSGTKKGCDHGQSGARTVSADDERVVSCLTLAASIDGCEVRTIEGIGTGADLHPLEGAVVEHDGFQCGYRTPGQISSVLALLGECHPPRTQFRVSVGNMTGATRPYRMTARAASAAQTATAILDASWELFEENVIADITLADIAARSGVTTQTVLRRFATRRRSSRPCSTSWAPKCSRGASGRSPT